MSILRTFTPPSDPQKRADWTHVMQCAQAFVDALERYAPAGPNRDEAGMRARKAAMVASGAFHVEAR